MGNYKSLATLLLFSILAALLGRIVPLVPVLILIQSPQPLQTNGDILMGPFCAFLFCFVPALAALTVPGLVCSVLDLPTSRHRSSMALLAFALTLAFSVLFYLLPPEILLPLAARSLPPP